MFLFLLLIVSYTFAWELLNLYSSYCSCSLTLFEMWCRLQTLMTTRLFFEHLLQLSANAQSMVKACGCTSLFESESRWCSKSTSLFSKSILSVYRQTCICIVFIQTKFALCHLKPVGSIGWTQGNYQIPNSQKYSSKSKHGILATDMKPLWHHLVIQTLWVSIWQNIASCMSVQVKLWAYKWQWLSCHS